MSYKTNPASIAPPKYDGWFYSKLSGTYQEIGYKHGKTHADMINKIIGRMKEYVYWSTGFKWDFLKEHIMDLWWKNIPAQYRDEISGISNGMQDTGVKYPYGDTQDIFLWNCLMEVLYYYLPTYSKKITGISNVLGFATPPDSCSAFIAVGDYTKDGKITMAHNSFTGFELAYMCLILDIETQNGDRFVMQTSPGQICSNTDFGVNNKGIMITETTIGGFNNYCNDEDKLKQLVPEFARARLAMETAGNFNEYIRIMKDGNTGGYANSWLVGDINRNEIMRFELGYAYAKETIIGSGYFVGFNAPIDPEIRNLECTNTGYMDIRRHQGARQVRLTQLVEKYRSEITPDVAKLILSDHQDPYLTQLEGNEIENFCSRNVDAHYELDPRKYMSQIGRPLPYQPQGAVDGKTADSTMARDLNFCVRFGSSSDIGFNADKFFEEHPQFNDMKDFIDSRPANPWTSVNEIAKNIP